MASGPPHRLLAGRGGEALHCRGVHSPPSFGMRMVRPDSPPLPPLAVALSSWAGAAASPTPPPSAGPGAAAARGARHVGGVRGPEAAGEGRDHPSRHPEGEARSGAAPGGPRVGGGGHSRGSARAAPPRTFPAFVPRDRLSRPPGPASAPPGGKESRAASPAGGSMGTAAPLLRERVHSFFWASGFKRRLPQHAGAASSALQGQAGWKKNLVFVF